MEENRSKTGAWEDHHGSILETTAWVLQSRLAGTVDTVITLLPVCCERAAVFIGIHDTLRV
jgi:hypothetical protein